MKRRLGSLVAVAGLVSTVLVGAAPATAGPPDGRPGPPPHAGPAASLGEIAIVPLDDRPFPAATPVEIAAAGGHVGVTPDVDLLGEFFTYGDADAVGVWWRGATEEADASVVALPMLAYGGLVASRACATDLATALARLDVLADVKAASPEHPVYAFDVIQRLTIEPTSGYPGIYSGPVRRWAELMDQVENLGREDLREAYEEVAAEIPEEVKDDYLCARARNHEVNRRMVHAAAEGIIDFLVLGQDDASEFGPHRAEKEALADLIDELGVADRVKIYPGADVLGALLTAKHVVERLDVTPTVAVEWSRTPGDEWVAPYQDIPYGELVDEYIGTLGAERTDAPAQADVLLMANTAGAGRLDPFVDRIHEAVSRGRLVAVGDDALAGVVDGELRDLVAARVDLAELAAWSGWNVGISLSQSVVRAALLEASRESALLAGSRDTKGRPVLAARERLLTSAAEAHQRLLLQELVHTDLYRNHVRDEVRRFAVDAGDDPQHMTAVLEQANDLAASRTRPLAEALFAEEFAGVPMRIGSDGQREHTVVVSALESLEMRLGWPRYQELDVFPELTLVDEHPAAPVAAALLPASLRVPPGVADDLTFTATLRNLTDRAAAVTVDVAAPEGWTTPGTADLVLAPFEIRDHQVLIGVPALAADERAAVALTVTPDSGTPDTAHAAVTAAWRNVALAEEGADVVASGWWNQYSPDRVIDGNASSVGSRWITEVGGEHWLEIHFARSETVDTVQLFQYGGYLLDGYTISALVAGQWRPVGLVTGNTETAPTHQFTAVEATAIRIDAITSRDNRVRLYEVEVTCRSGPGCG